MSRDFGLYIHRKFINNTLLRKKYNITPEQVKLQFTGCSSCIHNVTEHQTDDPCLP